MNKRWLLFSVVMGLVLLVVVPAGRALAQDTTTFQVNMKIQIMEGKFSPTTDTVTVSGDFNGWDTHVDMLTDPNHDSVYTGKFSLAAGSINYKFVGSSAKTGYEGVATNRTYTVVAGTQTLPVVYFGDDSVYHANVSVTFQVNMKVKMHDQAFKPQNGDIVTIRGSLNNWGNTANTDTLKDPNGDSIYTKTYSLVEASNVQYKFWDTHDSYENVANNRSYTVPVGGGTSPLVYFADDSIPAALAANMLWQADMSAYETIGWFRPDLNDSLEVRGSFTGWGGTKMLQSVSDINDYELAQVYVGNPGDILPYKFHINLDSTSAVTRFPGIIFGTSNNLDDIQYDHTYDLGDGNRTFTVTTGGNVSSPSNYFASIHRYGLLLNSTDTVNVTMRVNMGPATRYLDPFVLADDTVKFVWHDLMWAFSQAKIQGSFPTVLNMTRNSGTDSVFSVTFKVIGPAHYGMMYYYRFVHKNGTTSVDEGGGLGVSAPDRVRFIQPLAPNSFPKSYTAPVDLWQKNAPMPGEVPPFGITGVKQQPKPVTPLTYKLSQNYPNPFNPTTRITYAIPEKAMVTLKVYNVIGQQVGTLVNQQETAGNYVVQFEGNNLPSGVYFYRLQAGKFSDVKKMLLMK